MTAGEHRRLSPRRRREEAGPVRSLTYRLYPTARERLALEELLDVQRQLYNAALDERRGGAWRWERRPVTRYDQYNGLTGAEQWCPELARFGRRVAQGSLDRLDEAFGHFLRRARVGERVGVTVLAAIADDHGAVELVADYDLIAVEDLRIPNMTRSARGTLEAPGRGVAAKRGLNRSIHDAGWGQLVSLLTYKAEGAGRQLVRVPTAHTSQSCAACGATHSDNRPDRDTFSCTTCGHTAHPDSNAAQVILAIATGRLTITRPPPIRRPGSGHRDAA